MRFFILCCATLFYSCTSSLNLECNLPAIIVPNYCLNVVYVIVVSDMILLKNISKLFFLIQNIANYVTFMQAKFWWNAYCAKSNAHNMHFSFSAQNTNSTLLSGFKRIFINLSENFLSSPDLVRCCWCYPHYKVVPGRWLNRFSLLSSLDKLVLTISYRKCFSEVGRQDKLDYF